ncbi:hypothetical protein [Dyella sp.]|uniref:hypothetical protein n=1 Tax=Dyella sp. TaxID=1869338 RepID=UPI002D78A1DE|nr:hypothetical protein [Dyella sp.]HET6431013.1 hypothetical protein [Dyella sp.]
MATRPTPPDAPLQTDPRQPPKGPQDPDNPLEPALAVPTEQRVIVPVPKSG